MSFDTALPEGERPDLKASPLPPAPQFLVLGVRRLGDLEAWRPGGSRWIGASVLLGFSWAALGMLFTMLQGSVGMILVHLGMLLGSL